MYGGVSVMSVCMVEWGSRELAGRERVIPA